jgi:hypothetical protein
MTDLVITVVAQQPDRASQSSHVPLQALREWEVKQRRQLSLTQKHNNENALHTLPPPVLSIRKTFLLMGTVNILDAAVPLFALAADRCRSGTHITDLKNEKNEKVAR